jgi:hypothetical protein
MKDISVDIIESGRPPGEAEDLINSCLQALYEDKEKEFQSPVVKNLSFEELIGTLLKARDYIKYREQMDDLLEEES